MEINGLKFRLNNEEVKFNVYQSKKKPRDMSVVLIIDVVEETDIGSLFRKGLLLKP